MITVFHVDTSLYMKQYSLNFLLNKLPPETHQRALQYRVKEDAYNFVFGRLMLQEALRVSDLSLHLLSSIGYNQHSKPSIEGLYFNISHSQSYVICAFSKTESLGADIEVYRPIEVQHLRSSFDTIEWNIIQNATDSLEQLYLYWTRKEALLKAIGKGLGELKNMHVHDLRQASYHDETWLLSALSIEKGLLGALCHQNEVEIKVERFLFAPY